MTFEIANPATRYDLAMCFGSGPRKVWHFMLKQLAFGESRAVRLEDGEVVAVVGLIPHDGEAWLCLSDQAPKHTLAIIRALRLTVQAVPYSPIYTVVLTQAGQRIARMAGFKRDEIVGDVEIWSWVKS